MNAKKKNIIIICSFILCCIISFMCGRIYRNKGIYGIDRSGIAKLESVESELRERIIELESAEQQLGNISNGIDECGILVEQSGLIIRELGTTVSDVGNTSSTIGETIKQLKTNQSAIKQYCYQLQETNRRLEEKLGELQSSFNK